MYLYNLQRSKNKDKTLAFRDVYQLIVYTGKYYSTPLAKAVVFVCVFVCLLLVFFILHLICFYVYQKGKNKYCKKTKKNILLHLIILYIYP